MKVVILAGGAGAKLLPLTQTIPKPLLPIVNAPLAQHLVHLLKRNGFTDLIFCLDDNSAAAQNVLGNGEAFGVNLSYVVESQPLGAAGALRQVAAELAHETFLVMGCNMLFNFNLQDFVKLHRQSHAVASLLAAPFLGEHNCDYGEAVELATDGSVLRVHRGDGLQHKYDLFPLGIYCFEPEVFAHYRPHEMFIDLKEQLLPRLREAGKSVRALQLPGQWQYLYQIEDYLKLHREVLEGNSTITPFMQQIQPRVWTGANVQIGAGVTIQSPVVIGDNVVIEDGALIIGPAAIGNNSRLGRNAVVQESVLWNNCNLREAGVVRHSLALNDVDIGAGRQCENAVIVNHRLDAAEVNVLEKKFNFDVSGSDNAADWAAPVRQRNGGTIKKTMEVFTSLFF